MSAYPIVIEMAGRLAVVVGGGVVGRRKVDGLRAAGARVRLISRDPLPPSCWTAGVELHLRPFHPEDLDGAVLAFAATGVAAVDQAVLAAARARGILASLAAAPELGDFTLPATLRRGELLLAVATGGRAPALAGVVRDRLGAEYGAPWALVVEIAARLRREKLTRGADDVYSSKVLADLLEHGLPALLAAGRYAEVDLLLSRVCGRGMTLEGLGLTVPDHPP